MATLGTRMSSRDKCVERELDTMRREFAWLLENEFVLKLEDIHKCLLDCGAKLAVVMSSSHNNDSHRIYLSHPQSENITCVATVDGNRISKADISVRLSSRQSSGKPLRTSIKEHTAWRLEQVMIVVIQIQDCANHFQIAYQQLQFIQDTQQALKTPSQLSRAFYELNTNLRKAEEVLVVPRLPSMAEIYSAEQRSHFKPELPEDTFVHFHINCSQLVLTIFSVTQTSKPSTTTGKAGSGNSFQIGSTFDHSGNTYEVTNQFQVQSPIPWLSAVLKLLKEAQEIAQDFTDKVSIFDAMLQSS